jgi:hypothetical protein
MSPEEMYATQNPVLPTMRHALVNFRSRRPLYMSAGEEELRQATKRLEQLIDRQE